MRAIVLTGWIEDQEGLEQHVTDREDEPDAQDPADLPPGVPLSLDEAVADGKEGTARQEHTHDVEPVPAAGAHIRDENETQAEHHSPDGHVDEEDPPPVERGDEQAAERRAR